MFEAGKMQCRVWESLSVRSPYVLVIVKRISSFPCLMGLRSSFGYLCCLLQKYETHYLVWRVFLSFSFFSF